MNANIVFSVNDNNNKSFYFQMLMLKHSCLATSETIGRMIILRHVVHGAAHLRYLYLYSYITLYNANLGAAA